METRFRKNLRALIDKMEPESIKIPINRDLIHHQMLFSWRFFQDMGWIKRVVLDHPQQLESDLRGVIDEIAGLISGKYDIHFSYTEKVDWERKKLVFTPAMLVYCNYYFIVFRTDDDDTQKAAIYNAFFGLVKPPTIEIDLPSLTKVEGEEELWNYDMTWTEKVQFVSYEIGEENEK